MLEKLPGVVGKLLRNARPGMEKIVSALPEIASAPETITVTSVDFSEGQPLPARFTADGDGLSPQLTWRGIPENASCVVLIVEDPDAPSTHPFVHAIVADLGTREGSVATGELSRKETSFTLGRNSMMAAKYLPPDPPRQHGVHRYVFQVFALDQKPEFDHAPGRDTFLESIRGHVIARGSLMGTYERR